MKRTLFFVLTLTSIASYSQTYSISNWLNNKSSATVLTFDDWDPASPGSSVPTMLSKEIAGTFFVTIDNAWRASDYPTMTEAAANGLEIANHTISHPSLISAANYAAEIENCRTILDANVTQDLPVHTFAYPYGDYNTMIINEVKKHHVGARAVSYTDNAWGYNYPTTNNEYFTIPTIQAGNMGTLNDFITELEDAIAGGGLYTIMYHSVGGLGWFDDIPQVLFEAQLDEVKAREEITWVTTFSNAVRYHKERHCATLTTISENINTWNLSFTDTLANNNIFSQALTIELTTPVGQTYENVQQDGNDIAYTISSNKLIFNAIPDGGDIVISKGEFIPTSITHELAQRIKIYPIPASDYITIDLPSTINLNSLNICNMQGKIMYTQLEKNNSNIDISMLPIGIYFVEITTDSAEKIIRKIIKN